MNALGLYLLVSLVFLILALVEFAFVALLSRRDKSVENNTDGDKVEKVTRPNEQNLKKTKMPDEQDVSVDGWLKVLGKVQCRMKIKPFSVMPSIHIVDVISFFPF